MNPVVINSQSIMQNICDKIVGSSVIFSYFTIKLSHKIFRNQQKSEKKMAGEKFNIEVAVNAQLESLNKIQDAIGELNQKLNGLSEGASDVNKVWSGAMYNIGAKMSDLALKFPSFATAAIQAFGQQEAAVQKLAAAIRSQGGNVSEVLPIMSSFASEIQRITIYGDEQVLSMQSMATAMGVSADQMNLCIQGAIGLTNVYGIGLNEAVRAAASAYPL